ncbi:hypothetical protein D3C73_1537190 [compost metagenome]
MIPITIPGSHVTTLTAPMIKSAMLTIVAPTGCWPKSSAESLLAVFMKIALAIA